FPAAKRALHRRQYHARCAAEAEVAAASHRRTREQDALALVDEGGVALLCADRELAHVRAALEARASGEIAAAMRRGATLGVIYGHAIYEHLVAGTSAVVRAMVQPLACSRIPLGASACVALADEELARVLDDPNLCVDPHTFRSMPVVADVLGTR